MPIDVNKILKLIQLIENEDGENLSFGSIRTLGMIKKELQKDIKTKEDDFSKWLDSQPFESYKTYLNKFLNEKVFNKTDIQEIKVGDIVKNQDELNKIIKQNKFQISGE